MYSGVDGREMEAQIFFGVVHYQRLRHMVSDKWQVSILFYLMQNKICYKISYTYLITEYGYKYSECHYLLCVTGMN